MPITKNLANEAVARDKSFCVPNRTNGGEPNGSLTPEYAGELVLDTTNSTMWKAIGLTNTSWIMMTPPGP